MAAAIILITVGSIMVISAIEGVSVTDVLKGVAGGKIDPRGGDTTGATTDEPSVGSDITQNPLGGLTGTTTIDGKPVANWIAKQVLYARTHGWGGKVLSGVRSDSEQRAACEHVCGNPNGCPGTCAAPGESNHRGTIYPLGAVDVSDPTGFARALSSYPGDAIRNDLPNDPGHFSATGH